MTLNRVLLVLTAEDEEALTGSLALSGTGVLSTAPIRGRMHPATPGGAHLRPRTVPASTMRGA